MIDEQETLRIDMHARVRPVSDSVDQVEARLLESGDTAASRPFCGERGRSDEKKRGVERLSVRRHVATLRDIGDQAVFEAVRQRLENSECLVDFVSGQTEAGQGDQGIPRPFAKPGIPGDDAGALASEVDQIGVGRVVELLYEGSV